MTSRDRVYRKPDRLLRACQYAMQVLEPRTLEQVADRLGISGREARRWRVYARAMGWDVLGVHANRSYLQSIRGWDQKSASRVSVTLDGREVYADSGAVYFGDTDEPVDEEGARAVTIICGDLLCWVHDGE